jgi:hypothetical protein
VLRLDQIKYKVTWDDGKITYLNLSPEQARNLSATKIVKSVELELG